MQTNAALRCERRLAILERSENAKRCESLLNALLCEIFAISTEHPKTLTLSHIELHFQTGLLLCQLTQRLLRCMAYHQ